METPFCDCVYTIVCEWYICSIFDAQKNSVQNSQGCVCACHCKEEIPPVYLCDKPLEARILFQRVSATSKNMEPSIVTTKILRGDQLVQVLKHACVWSDSYKAVTYGLPILSDRAGDGC